MIQVNLIGGDEFLRQAVRKPFENVKLNSLESVLECYSLNSSELLLIPETLRECSGLELIKLLKQKKNRPRLIFIASDSLVRDEAFVSGADECFTLPLSEEFREKVLTEDKKLPSLSGAISEFPLFETLQFLFSARATGELSVGGEASLYFSEGELIHAAGESNNLSSVDQVKHLLSSKEGKRFEFAPGDVSGITRTIEARTDHLLLTLASQIDEDSP